MNKMYRIHSLNELLRLPNTPEYIKKEVYGIMAETKEAGGGSIPLCTY
jgi:predicted SPOUT superfamily RNA methylase MTH1